MSIVYPKNYTTSDRIILPCGCMVDVEISIYENGPPHVVPTITYCRLHSLGVVIFDTIKKEL